MTATTLYTVPANEKERLGALYRYEILDTPPEATFDRITSIVAAVFDVPIAVMSLVDNDRSWFKSYCGLDTPQLDRASTMCNTVIQQDDVYVVTDAHTPLPGQEVRPLLNLGLRFFAGAPLRTHDGYNLGTLCALDAEPREVTLVQRKALEDLAATGYKGRNLGQDCQVQRKILEDLAATVVDEMELRLAARRIAEADESLRRLNEQLAAANQNKSQFLSSMSHELRTPLNAILGASELLRDGLFGRLSEKQEEYVSDIHDSGKHLLSLINDVLDLSRIEAGRLELRQTDIDVKGLMDSCAATLRGWAAEQEIHMEINPPGQDAVFNGDERRIKQILYNLLSNALKFTPAGGAVRFSGAVRVGEVVFSVEDSGPGIPAEYQEKVFDQFFQVHNESGGSGLGLSLAKQLAELHRGRIWFESDAERGSRFFVALPAG